jgi:hypothetical protein
MLPKRPPDINIAGFEQKPVEFKTVQTSLAVFVKATSLCVLMNTPTTTHPVQKMANMLA